MKTECFKRVAISKEWKQNLQVLATLSVESANKVLDWLQSKQEYPRLDAHDLAEIAEATGESGDVLASTLRTIHSFIGQITLYDDNVDDFYADVKDLKVIDDKIGYKTLDAVFARLPLILEKYRLFMRRSRTEDYGAPVLSSSSMTAAMKPVFARKFSYDKDSLEKYKPTPIDHVVVALIELEKTDSNNSFAFQLNRDNLDRFVTDLLALQAETRILEEKLRTTIKYIDET